MISIKDFAGERPAIDRKLLPGNGAQSAINCNLKNNKLRSYMEPRKDAYSITGSPLSIYRQRETGGWLDWETDVDVIRSPLDTTPDTLIYTGDGRPKIRGVNSNDVFDLGLPAPIAAPEAVVASSTNSGTINNVSRIILETYTTAVGTTETFNHHQQLYPNVKTLSIPVSDSDVISIRVNLNVTIPHTDAPQNVNSGYVLFVYRDYQNLAAISNGTSLETPIFTRVYPIYYFGGQEYRQVVDTFLDQPSTETHTYAIRWQEQTQSINDLVLNDPHNEGGGLNWDIEARVNNRIRVDSGVAHALFVDARVQFKDITGTGTFPSDLNLKIFSVVTIVDADTFDIQATAEGTYSGGGTWSQYFTQSDTESRAYRYTYVATIGGVDYEGPGSDASVVVDAGQGQKVTLSGFSPFPFDWNSPADRLRLYRFAASSSTTGQYQFVAEIVFGTASYDDLVLGADLGESLPTPDRQPPPADLRGIVELPSGGAAGFTGKTIYLAEPNFLHSWPLAYARNAHDDIVAIGAFGSSIVITTVTQPYILTGTDPAGMTMDKLELGQPNLSKRGSVDMGYSFVYPAPDGLMLVATGRAEIVTLSLFNKEDWAALDPTTFVAGHYDNQYVCFYEALDGTRGGFILDPLAPQRGVTFLDFWANAVWTDQSDGNLYFARGKSIQVFNGSTIELTARWRSKEFVTQDTSFTVGRVTAKKYPAYMSVFCDGQESASVTIYSKNDFRLPRMKGREWSVEVRSQHQIDEVYLAENMEELGYNEGGG